MRVRKIIVCIFAAIFEILILSKDVQSLGPLGLPLGTKTKSQSKQKAQASGTVISKSTKQGSANAKFPSFPSGSFSQFSSGQNFRRPQFGNPQMPQFSNAQASQFPNVQGPQFPNMRIPQFSNVNIPELRSAQIPQFSSGNSPVKPKVQSVKFPSALELPKFTKLSEPLKPDLSKEVISVDASKENPEGSGFQMPAIPELPDVSKISSDLLNSPNMALNEIRKFNSLAELAKLPPMETVKPVDTHKIFSDFEKFIPQNLLDPSNVSSQISQFIPRAPMVDIFGEQHKIIMEQQDNLKNKLKGSQDLLQMPMDIPIFSLNPHSPILGMRTGLIPFELGDPLADFDFGPSLFKPKGKGGSGHKKRHRKFKLGKLNLTDGKNATFGEDTDKKRKISNVIYGDDGGRNVTVSLQDKNSTKTSLFHSFDKEDKDGSVKAFQIVNTF
ncbi:unnamed protein product [Allacma fusca]|uniref:Uncharacterized protein n=1 Tax=Allacma fusca TaxID=39272 RepID=A0A8J2JBZ3_9HEXA|nr:unnamed protein product [Allacma fusca]